VDRLALCLHWLCAHSQADWHLKTHCTSATLAQGHNAICPGLRLPFVGFQIDHVRAERDVLAEVHNPYVVKLYYSFQVTCL